MRINILILFFLLTNYLIGAVGQQMNPVVKFKEYINKVQKKDDAQFSTEINFEKFKQQIFEWKDPSSGNIARIKIPLITKILCAKTTNSTDSSTDIYHIYTKFDNIEIVTETKKYNEKTIAISIYPDLLNYDVFPDYEKQIQFNLLNALRSSGGKFSFSEEAIGKIDLDPNDFLLSVAKPTEFEIKIKLAPKKFISIPKDHVISGELVGIYQTYPEWALPGRGSVDFTLTSFNGSIDASRTVLKEPSDLITISINSIKGDADQPEKVKEKEIVKPIRFELHKLMFTTTSKELGSFE